MGEGGFCGGDKYQILPMPDMSRHAMGYNGYIQGIKPLALMEKKKKERKAILSQLAHVFTRLMTLSCLC